MRRLTFLLAGLCAALALTGTASADPDVSGTVVIAGTNTLYPTIDVSASITSAACDPTDGYCGWFGFATVVPNGTACSPYATDVWSSAISDGVGTEAGTVDPGSVPDDGTICVYAFSPTGTNLFAASAPFTLPSPGGTAAITLNATTLPLQGTSVAGTVSVTQTACEPAACSWLGNLTIQKGRVCPPTYDSTSAAALPWVSDQQTGSGTISDDYTWSSAPSSGSIVACAYISGAGLASVLVGSHIYTFAAPLTLAAAKPRIAALLHQRTGRTRSLTEHCTRPSRAHVSCTLEALTAKARWTGRNTVWTVANSTKIRSTITLHKTTLAKRH